MKTLNLVLALTLASGSALAAAPTTSEIVFKALSVSEQNVTPEHLVGSAHFQKYVGGLTCMRYQSVTANPTSSYNCALSFENRNDGEIYNSLNVKEVNTTPAGLMGASWYEKSVGNFRCEKILGVYPNAVPSYSCSLK